MDSLPVVLISTNIALTLTVLGLSIQVWAKQGQLETVATGATTLAQKNNELVGKTSAQVVHMADNIKEIAKLQTKTDSVTSQTRDLLRDHVRRSSG